MSSPDELVPLGTGPLEPDSTPAALAGGAACDPSAAPDILTAGPAESAGHPLIVILPPTARHPRGLTLKKDPQLAAWWSVFVDAPNGNLLVYGSTFDRPPRIQIEGIYTRLIVDRALFSLALEEVELLRPLTAHGLVIEEGAT